MITSEREECKCECVDRKDAWGRIFILRADCAVDMEVHYEVEIR